MKRTGHFRSVAVLAIAALLAASCADDKASDTDTTGGGSSTTAPEAALIDTSLCKDYQPTAGITGDTIKIGTVLPETGKYDIYKGIGNGLDAYVKSVNAAGGIKAKDGKSYKLELVREDDQYVASNTLAKVQKLVLQDKVFAIVGEVGTSNNLVVRDYLNEQCVPSISVATGSTNWGNPDYRWMISGLPSYATEAHRFMDFLKTQKPDATIAVLYQETADKADDFGKAYLDRIQKDIAGTGMKVVASQPYDLLNTATAEVEITKLAQSKADVLFLGIGGAPCPSSLKFIPADWKPMIYISITCAGGLAMAIAGARAEGLYSTQATYDPANPDTATKPGVKEFLDAGAAQGIAKGDLENGILSAGWGFGAVFGKAVETATAVTRADVMTAAFNFKDVKFGLIRDDVKVHTAGVEDPWALEDLAIIHREGGKWVDAAPVVSYDGKSNELAKG